MPQKEYYPILDTNLANAEELANNMREAEDLDWWDEPVEGESEEINEQVDKGNQPIPQPTKPEIKPKKINQTNNSILPATEAEPQEKVTIMDECLKSVGAKEMEPAWEYYSDLAWNPWAMNKIKRGSSGAVISNNQGTTHSQIPGQTEQRKVNSRVEDDAKSNPHILIHTQPNLDRARAVSISTDPKVTFLKGQHTSNQAEIAKMKDIPCQEGIGPTTHTLTTEFFELPLRISSDQSRGEGGPDTTSTIAIDMITIRNLEDRGATHSNTTKCDF